MNDSEYICPVPKDQRPLNEYQKLKESSSFLWCIQDRLSFFKSFFYLLISSCALTSLILVASSFPFTSNKYFFLYSSLAGIAIVTLLCLRLYLGWQYIYSRLMEATVPYEESGWYDGQVWIKPPEVLLQDRLIGTYEIYPGLLRLQMTVSSLLVIFILGVTLIKKT